MHWRWGFNNITCIIQNVSINWWLCSRKYLYCSKNRFKQKYVIDNNRTSVQKHVQQYDIISYSHARNERSSSTVTHEQNLTTVSSSAAPMPLRLDLERCSKSVQISSTSENWLKDDITVTRDQVVDISPDSSTINGERTVLSSSS